MSKMRYGFTIVELIFVIVIVGILAAVAVPKFTHLKQNAEASNVLQAVNDLNTSGKGAYLNETELNNKDASAVGDLHIDDIYDFKGSRWAVESASRAKATYTSSDGLLVVEFTLGHGSTAPGTGKIDVNVTKCDAPYDALPKLGTNCDEINASTIDFN